MAWGSSAAQNDRARLAGLRARGMRRDGGEVPADAEQQHWLMLAALLQLALLVAVLPAAPYVAMAAISVGSGFVVLAVYRSASAPAAPHLQLRASTDAAGEARTAPEDGATAGDAIDIAAGAVTSAQPARPSDVVWSEIMGQISHELRTPLNAIIGFSDLMERELYGPVGDPRYQEYLAHIRDSGRSLLKSAEDTLALTELLANRGAESVPSVIDLEDLVAGCVGRAGYGRASSIRFDRQSARGLDVQGDRRALHQILLNVVAEAVERAGDQRHAVTVCVRARALIDIAAPSPVSGSASLRLALARMMLELDGGSLTEAFTTADGAPLWRATVSLDLVRQPDLFAC